MKKLLFAALLVGLLTPAAAVAQSSFDGTWKINLDQAKMPDKPDVFVLQNGTYRCSTCIPMIEVKADGQDYPITGHPYYDTVAIEVVDDNTIRETDKKSGNVVATSRTTVAPDGKTALVEFTDSSNTNSDPVTGKVTIMKVADGPAGAHAVSGSWRMSHLENISDNGLTFTYKTVGDSLMMTSPTGQTYTARMDGRESRYSGDPGISTVRVKRLDANRMEETDVRDGKIISVAMMRLSPDGRTMTIEVSDKLHGTTSSFVAERQ